MLTSSANGDVSVSEFTLTSKRRQGIKKAKRYRTVLKMQF